MFTQIRRRSKKLSNVTNYIKWKLKTQEPGDWERFKDRWLKYLVNHFEELFAFGLLKLNTQASELESHGSSAVLKLEKRAFLRVV